MKGDSISHVHKLISTSPLTNTQFSCLTNALEFLIYQPPTTLPTLVHEICLSLSTLHCSSSYYVLSLCKKSCVITRYFLSLALSNMLFRKIKTEFLLGEGARRDEKYVHNLGGRLCVMETEPSDIN